jgi:hypothetical protein
MDIPPTGSTQDFNERFGPFYSVESTARLLKCTEQEVRAAIRDRTLLAIRFADGVTGLPTRQFDEDVHPLPGLQQLAVILDPMGNDPLAGALVVFTPSEFWGGGTAAEWMRDGRLEEALAAARRARRSLDAP